MSHKNRPPYVREVAAPAPIPGAPAPSAAETSADTPPPAAMDAAHLAGARVGAVVDATGDAPPPAPPPEKRALRASDLLSLTDVALRRMDPADLRECRRLAAGLPTHLAQRVAEAKEALARAQLDAANAAQLSRHVLDATEAEVKRRVRLAADLASLAADLEAPAPAPATALPQ